MMTMLNLNNILWVIPGVLFIFLFNKHRPQKSISLSGWPYVFFIVVIASITWLPAEWILKFISYKSIICIPFQLIISVLISFILFLLVNWSKSIAHLISLPVNDNFYNKCIEWENKSIILTLKNGKAYIGILWKYPENSKSRHESQTISIVPIKSGYRKEDTKQVIWNTDYLEYKQDTLDIHYSKDSEDKAGSDEIELIIPRSEIITFGKFNEKIFQYFNP